MTKRQQRLLAYLVELIESGALQKGRQYAGIEILVPFADDFEAIAGAVFENANESTERLRELERSNSRTENRGQNKSAYWPMEPMGHSPPKRKLR